MQFPSADRFNTENLDEPCDPETLLFRERTLDETGTPLDMVEFRNRVTIALVNGLGISLAAACVLAIPFHIHDWSWGILSPVLSPLEFLARPLTLFYIVTILIATGAVIIAQAAQVEWQRPLHMIKVGDEKGKWFWFWFALYGCIYCYAGLFILHASLNILDFKYTTLAHYRDTCTVLKNDYGGRVPCLDEKHLFILCAGMFSSVHGFLRYRVYYINVVKFPILEVPIWSHIQFSLPAYFKQACGEVLFDLLSSYVAYYSFGGLFRESLVYITSWSLDNEPGDSLWVLFDLELFAFTFICSCCVLMYFKITWDVLQLGLTSRLEFDVDIEKCYPGRVALARALEYEGYFRHLGYYDFKCLTSMNSSRYAKLFRLSHPGGNPANWDAVFGQTISFLRKNMERLQVYTDELTVLEHGVVPSRPQSKSNTTQHLAQTLDQKVADCKPELRKLALLQSMRNMSSVKTKETPKVRIDVYPKAQYLIAAAQMATNMLQESPLKKYVLEKGRELRIRSIFNDTQLVVWALQSIGNIALDSINYDYRGVVQKDLAQIFYLCIDYYETINTFRNLNIRAPPTPGFENKLISFDQQEMLWNCLKVLVTQLTHNLHYYFELLDVDPAYDQKIGQFIKFGYIPSWVEWIR